MAYRLPLRVELGSITVLLIDAEHRVIASGLRPSHSFSMDEAEADEGTKYFLDNFKMLAKAANRVGWIRSLLSGF